MAFSALSAAVDSRSSARVVVPSPVAAVRLTGASEAMAPRSLPVEAVAAPAAVSAAFKPWRALREVAHGARGCGEAGCEARSGGAELVERAGGVARWSRELVQESYLDIQVHHVRVEVQLGPDRCRQG